MTSSPALSDYCIVLTTTDKEDVAKEIAGKLVEADLAACVQIDQVNSFYKWEGKVQNDNEYRLMVKARSSNYDLIEKKITSLHNYQLPQILKLDISGGSKAYLDWLAGK